MLCFQSLLAVPGPAPLGEVVHRGELDQGREHEGVAHGDEPVHGCGIGHFGERVPGADAEGGHGQDRGHTWVQTQGQGGELKMSLYKLLHCCCSVLILPGAISHR